MMFLTQINTGTPFDPILNALFVQYGALPTAIIVIVGIIVLSWRTRNDAQSRQEQADAKTQDAVTNLATKQTDRLNEVQSDFLNYKTVAEYQRGLLEGRITELGNTIVRSEKRYDDHRKEWETKFRELEQKHQSNEKKIADLQAELSTKSEEILSLQAEVERLRLENLDKTAQIQRLNNTISQLIAEKEKLEAQIKALTKPISDDTIPLPELPDTKELPPIIPLETKEEPKDDAA